MSPKPKSEWFVAALFFLVAGLLAPYIVGFSLQTIYFMGASAVVSGSLGGLLGTIATCVAIHYSVKYVANSIRQRYEVGSTLKTALIAVGYFIVIMFPWSLYQMGEQVSPFTNSANGQGFAMMLELYHFVVLCIFAYVLYKSIRRFYTSA